MKTYIYEITLTIAGMIAKEVKPVISAVLRDAVLKHFGKSV